MLGSIDPHLPDLRAVSVPTPVSCGDTPFSSQIWVMSRCHFDAFLLSIRTFARQELCEFDADTTSAELPETCRSPPLPDFPTRRSPPLSGDKYPVAVLFCETLPTDSSANSLQNAAIAADPCAAKPCHFKWLDTHFRQFPAR